MPVAASPGMEAPTPLQAIINLVIQMLTDVLPPTLYTWPSAMVCQLQSMSRNVICTIGTELIIMQAGHILTRIRVDQVAVQQTHFI